LVPGTELLQLAFEADTAFGSPLETFQEKPVGRVCKGLVDISRVLVDVKLALHEADFNPDFLRGFLRRNPGSNGSLFREVKLLDNIHHVKY
jgi:hypothetical protein